MEADLWYNPEMRSIPATSDIIAYVLACIDIAVAALYPLYIVVKESRHAD